MRYVEKEGIIPYYEFEALADTELVRHLFTTRIGGASHGYQESLNLNFNQGDEPEAVRENYHRVAKALGVEDDVIICSMQTHTTNVQRVGAKDAGRGVTKPLDIVDIDGMVTNEPGIVLATFYADCVPLYFVDPVKKAIGLSHSGWKGTVNRMGQATVDKMILEFGSNPEDIIAAIGPSICQKCYEVSNDVAEQFIKEFGESVAYKTDEKHYQLDLWKANELVLLDAGIKKCNIHVSGICTCCHNDIFFSHRASNGKRGNLGAFLGLL
ncbi:MAG: peptidoglycan editing factor PgeF [Pseudobutyrivibrio sp.]|nr:peptidoglycan editing factor PgeF [Pseudobutyrivibrio sp.]